MVKAEIDYSRGKIYKIWSPSTDKIYIGSTTKQYLSQRLTNHVHSYKRWQNGEQNQKLTSYKLIELGDYIIELVEAFPCQSKDALLAREGHFIREFKDVVVNRCIVGRTVPEYGQLYRA